MKKLLSLSLICAVICILGTASCTKDDRAAKADAAMQQILEKYGNVGIAAVVIKDGKMLYENRFGYKDLEAKTPIKKTDIFRIASISKSFVATSIMQLVEAGKISLDNDVSDLIGFTVRNPKYPDQVITLKMIMSHTSSMSDAGGYFTLNTINPAVTEDASVSFHEWAPGEKYDYCNLGYNLTGAILEKISGVRFDHYVRENIFDKLGLYGGHNIDDLDASRFVKIYEPEDGKMVEQPAAYVSRAKDLESYVLGYTTPIFSPTGGIKISAIDLAKYMTMHINKGEYNGIRIISEESANMMQSLVCNFSETTGYGLALNRADDFVPGMILNGHTGSAYGLYSAMYFNPAEKWGVVVITNGAEKNHRHFLREAVNELYIALIK